VWEAAEASSNDTNVGSKRLRHGRVRIPSRCLREIIEEHKSFASRICMAPVNIDFDMGLKEGEKEKVVVVGDFVEVKVNVRVEDWVPIDIMSKCSVALEFCCAKKESSTDHNDESNKTSYIWCGQIRRITKARSKDVVITHQSRVSFIQRGAFVISACVKIGGEHGGEEIWWAPRAETVVVNKEKEGTE